MRKKLMIEGLISLISVLNTTPANGSDLQQKIYLEPNTYTMNVKLEPLNGLQFVCSTNYIRFKPNGECSMDYRKDIGYGRLEVKGYKPLTDKGFYIGMKYKIEW